MTVRNLRRYNCTFDMMVYPSKFKTKIAAFISRFSYSQIISKACTYGNTY